MLETTQLSLFRTSCILFLLESSLYPLLLLLPYEPARAILSIPYIYIIPGCLLLLSIRKESIDIIKLLLSGFLISAFLGTGTSIIMGISLGSLNQIIFMTALIAVSFLSLILTWKQKQTHENFILLDKYAALSLILTAAFFVGLIIFYSYNHTDAPSDGARYFHAAQNYIRSFSFSPYPPYPLQMWETAAANIGGAIAYRNLWVILVALQTLVAKTTSILPVQTLNFFMTSMLALATFNLGSLVSNKKLGTLAAFFTALNTGIIFYAAYEVPYISVALFALLAFAMYISAVGGEKKNFKLAFLSLFILLTAVMLHVTVFFLALALIPHFLFVMFKHGGKYAKAACLFLIVVFGLVGSYFFSTFITPRNMQYMSVDLERSLWTVYSSFLMPVFFTIPIWILFITGILLTFAHKENKHNWSLSLGLTLFGLAIYLVTFAYFRFGVTFRWFLVFVPLMTIIAAYGFLETIKKYKRDLFFVGTLFFILIVYLANQYPWALIFPFGIVTLNEIYLTFIPAAFVLAWKVIWKEAYDKRRISIRKIPLTISHILSSLFIILVSVALISETLVFVANPQTGIYINPADTGLQEAGAWINSNIEPGSILATNAWTHLGLYVDYTRTPIVAFPSNEPSLQNWVSQGKIDYFAILTNLYASNDFTWFHIYPYLKKYADPKIAPPLGTIEYHREQNFAVFKVVSSYGLTTNGVLTQQSANSEIWILENGFVRLNITHNALSFSSLQSGEYVAISQLDFENTDLTINGATGKLGKWDSIQFLNYTTSNWENWTEASHPLDSSSYTQQLRVRLLWKNLGNVSLSTYVTQERGRSFSKIRWAVSSSDNSIVTIFPSIRSLGMLNRAYIPSSQPNAWSTNSTLRGNPANESMYGLGFILSHTSGVMLSKGDYTAQQLPSSVVLPEKTQIWGLPAYTYTFNITNEMGTGQWAVIEAYVPDSLVDQDKDGFYNVGLQSYNVNDGNWWDFARWDASDVGSDASQYGPWADSARATLIDGTKLSVGLGLNRSDQRGIALFDIGERNKTVGISELPIAPFIVPENLANITYSGNYGLVKRLGFAIQLPGKQGAGSSELRLRLYISYDESASLTYEFSTSKDQHYGMGSMDDPFIWLYNINEPKPSMGVILNRKPSFFSATVNAGLSYTSLKVGYNASEAFPESQQFHTSFASLEAWPWGDFNTNRIPDALEGVSGDTAPFLSLSSLADYNFTFEESPNDVVTMNFEKMKIDNDFNSEPLYNIAIDEKWTWISGGSLLRSIQDNDLLFDVAGASSISYKMQPKAIDPDLGITAQTYNPTGKVLRIRLASGYAFRETYGTTIIYMLRRVFVYCGNLKPIEVYVNSKPYERLYDEKTKLLKITIYEVAEAEIEVILNTP